MDNKELAKYIDHTLLRPEAKESEVLEACQQAREYQFKTVCLHLNWMEVASKELKGSGVSPIAVIGFPEGNQETSEKVGQTKNAISLGAMEIDMVLNRDLLEATKYQEAMDDIREVVTAAKEIPVKVILETSQLSERQKVMGCVLAKLAGAAFVKTSTGFAGGGATVEDVKLMRETVGSSLGVKASGGIRDRKTAEAMIAAGASRLGCSASVAIVTGGQSEGSY